MSQRLGNRFQRIETWCAILLLSAIVVLVAVAAVTRAMGSPIIWSIEIAQLCFVWLSMLCADLAMQHHRHFGLSLLSDTLGPRARAVVELVNRLVIVVLLAYLAVYAWRNAVLMHPRLIGATQFHASLLHGSMVAGLLLLLRTMVAQTHALWRDWPANTGQS